METLNSQLENIRFDRSIKNPKSSVEDYMNSLSKNSTEARFACAKRVVRYLSNAKGIENASYIDICYDLKLWKHLTGEFILEFREWMETSGYSYATKRQTVSFLTTQFRLARDSGIISPQEFLHIKTMSAEKNYEKDDRDNKYYYQKLTDCDVDTVISSHDLSTNKGIRDRMIFSILSEHGLRVGEMLGIMIEDVDLTNRSFSFYRSKSRVRSVAHMTQLSFQSISDFLKACGRKEGALISAVNKSGAYGKPTSNRSVPYRLVKTTCAEVLGKGDISPHDFRHFWATRRAIQGATAFQLMQEGGWKNLDSVMIYIHLAEKERKKAYPM